MKRAGKYVLLGVIGLILVATFRFLWKSSRPETAFYEIVTPQSGHIESTVTATGNIEPRNEILVKPEISGIISKIMKSAGDPIREGEAIATVKIITETSALNTAESRLRVTQIALEQISKEYERQTLLFQNDVISKNEYDISEANYRKAVEENLNAEDALSIAQRGIGKRAVSVNNTIVRSRISGTIIDIPVKEGVSVIATNVFNEGTTIAVVAKMDDLIFRGTVDETEVGKIREGMSISISVGAVSNETIDATLEYIASKGKKENGTVTYEIKAAIKTPETIRIRANYSANADIIIEQAQNVILIPESVIEFDKGDSYVYLLKEDTDEQAFIRKQIEIGLSDGMNVEVKTGLRLTDKVRGNKIDIPM